MTTLGEEGVASLHSSGKQVNGSHEINVGRAERVVSIAGGSMLALLGIGRRDVSGLLIAGLGGALAYRGATGHCGVYERLGVDTTDGRSSKGPDRLGVHICQSFLIRKSPEELYAFWRDFEQLPAFMSHLQSVRNTGARTSRWAAKAPALYGGSVEWDAEIVSDEPNRLIAWRSLPNADVANRGQVRFEKALGDRGTRVQIELDYDPPFGTPGRWLAKLFGEEPETQIREDLRRFQRLMEVGEIPTIEGQPHGTCKGRGEYLQESSWLHLG